jgi:NO-binding membrane sensor protein with MHYT domain
MDMAHQYGVGDVVPYRYNPLIVVAACIITLIGSATTVELLHRKRGTRQTWINWYGVLLCNADLTTAG